ncbi:hypothetical protein EVA_09529, partial [gut metagenome]
MPVEFFRIDMTKCWFIDLDDSIFEASGGMLHAIHLRMNVVYCERTEYFMGGSVLFEAFLLD